MPLQLDPPNWGAGLLQVRKPFSFPSWQMNLDKRKGALFSQNLSGIGPLLGRPRPCIMKVQKKPLTDRYKMFNQAPGWIFSLLFVLFFSLMITDDAFFGSLKNVASKSWSQNLYNSRVEFCFWTLWKMQNFTLGGEQR